MPFIFNYRQQFIFEQGSYCVCVRLSVRGCMRACMHVNVRECVGVCM